MNTDKQELLYLQAKSTYYAGHPIMTDLEFDALEEELKKAGSKIVGLVGSNEEFDVPHLSSMLSLSKIQVWDDAKLPIDQFTKWAKPGVKLEVTPKYDGSSCVAVYRDGTLSYAITRGDGQRGTDITAKMKLILPTSINRKGLVEVRGEILVKKSVFARKYAKTFRNARNMVAGVLGRKDGFEDVVRDFTFLAFEARVHDDAGYRFAPAITLADHFDVPVFTYTDRSMFPSTYVTMKHYRDNHSEFLLDGFVIKYPEGDRLAMGEGSHDPKWAVAVKFPPLEAVTDIVGIQWETGKGGEFTPVGLLTPVDLSGSTVSRVSLYNLRNVIDQGLWPGAKVVIVKSGEIIPAVTRVVTPEFNRGTGEPPANCSCGAATVEGPVELHCPNPKCPARAESKLRASIVSMDIKNIGDSAVEKLTLAGIRNVFDLFDRAKFNPAALTASGHFKPGRALDILIDAVRERKEMTLSEAIVALQFPSVGRTISKQVSKMIRKQPHDFAGLSAAAYEPFTRPDSDETRTLKAFVRHLVSNGVRITEEQDTVAAGSVLIEMTGSPKPFWQTKEELLAQLGGKVSHHGLKPGVQFLVTDDPGSTSGKMAKAAKMGVKVITYSELQRMTA